MPFRQFASKAVIPCLLASLLLVCEASAQGSDDPPHATDPNFSVTPGYLDRSELPDSLQLLPPPPDPASATFRRDEEARSATLPIRGTARWELAGRDANLEFPQPAENFSCAMGVHISEENTPRLFKLMQKLTADAGLSTYRTKNKYNRTRPFMEHDEATCRREQEDILRKDGSYPSGHSGTGWAWALAFAEINPERANEILRRGLEFGQSRVICDAHWQSDVDAGRIMGAATIARLQANAEFRADMEAAKAEVEKAKGAESALPSHCELEARALSSDEGAR